MRYLLFAGSAHERHGGAHDCVGVFATLMEAQGYLHEHPAAWAHVASFDGATLRIVWACGEPEDVPRSYNGEARDSQDRRP